MWSLGCSECIMISDIDRKGQLRLLNRHLHPPTAMAMADVQVPPLNQIPQAAPLVPDASQPPAQSEVVSETLYIQNLNEKIKVDGQHPR